MIIIRINSRNRQFLRVPQQRSACIHCTDVSVSGTSPIPEPQALKDGDMNNKRTGLALAVTAIIRDHH